MSIILGAVIIILHYNQPDGCFVRNYPGIFNGNMMIDGPALSLPKEGFKGR
jgi:hypothetical protein